MTTALLMISDGRNDVHARSMLSAHDMLPGFDHIVHVQDPDHTLGFAGAVQEGWRQVLETDAAHVFHLELDFTFHRPVDVPAMIGVLERHRNVAQVALKRQAWNEQEKAAGGIVEQHPDDYCEIFDGVATYTTHRRFWTTNPCVYSTELCHMGWPQVPQSEGIFTHELLKRPNLRFAFLGGKHDPPLVHHIGDTRAGCGY